MHGSDRVPDLNMDYERAYGWKGNTIHESEMALFFECMQYRAQKVLDTGRHCQRCDVLYEPGMVASQTLCALGRTHRIRIPIGNRTIPGHLSLAFRDSRKAWPPLAPGDGSI